MISIKEYILKLKANSFLKNVLIIATGTAAGQAIGMLATPVITRIYTPEDFGLFTTFMAIIAIIGSFATLRYSVAIPVAESNKLANNVLKLSFVISFVLSLLISIIIYFIGSYLLIKFSSVNLLPYLWLIPIIFLGKGIYEALNNWALRNKYFKTIATTKLSQSVSGATFKIGLGWLGFIPIGLFIGVVIQNIAGIGTLLIKLIKTEKGFFKTIDKEEIVTTAIRFKKFPLYQIWSQILLALGPQLPIFFIAAQFGSKTVGLFGLANSMINMPMNLIGSSISQVYFAEIAQLGKNKPAEILKLSKSIIKKLFILGLIPMLLLIFFGPFLFSFIFGSEWAEAGIFARILTIMIMTRFFSAPIMQSLNVFELQNTQLQINIYRILLITIVFIICKYFNLTEIEVILFYSIVMSFYSLLLLYFILRKIQNYSSKDFCC